jgi:chromosome segregation ATPase
MESEHYLAIVEESLSQLELLLTEFIVDYEFLLSSLESAKDELSDKDTTFKELVSEFMTSKDMNLNLQLEVEDLKSQNEFLQEEISTLTTQIDQLKDSVNYAENSESLLMSRLQDIESMYDTLKSEIEQIRFHLKIGDEGDILETLIKLQQEYEDLIEENYRMQEIVSDLESEIEELHAETEELHSKSLSEASCKLPTKFSDNQEIKQQLDDLEVKLQAVIKERDFWKDIAERYKSVPVEGDELLTSTIRTDATEQKKLLQQAMEYCGRRDARKSWVFSSFSSQRQLKADHNVNDDLEREHLIDRLTEANKSYQETIMKLKSEVVGLNTSLKEESYTMRKKVDSLEQEKQAYEMKALTLEQELCRMIEHEERGGPSNTV